MAWEWVERIMVTFLASKDIKQFHIDLNVAEFLIGRSNTLGVDKNQQVNLAFSHAIYRGPEFTGKGLWRDRLDRTMPGFVSSPQGADLHSHSAVCDR